MKRMTKKLMSVLTVFVIGLAAVPVNSAQAYSDKGSTVVNANAGNMVEKVTQKLGERKSRIVLYYTGSSNSFYSNFAALTDLTVPCRNQTARRSVDFVGYDVDTSFKEKGVTKYILSPEYLLSDSQARALDRKANSIVRGLHLRGSAYNKALKINDYLARHVKYAYEPISAYDAIIRGKGCCQAYSEAFYLLARKAGLNVKMVYGNAYSMGYWSAHQWNVFKQGKSWYSIDPCWNSPEWHHYWTRKGLKMKDHRLDSKCARMLRKC